MKDKALRQLLGSSRRLANSCFVVAAEVFALSKVARIRCLKSVRRLMERGDELELLSVKTVKQGYMDYCAGWWCTWEGL